MAKHISESSIVEFHVLESEVESRSNTPLLGSFGNVHHFVGLRQHRLQDERRHAQPEHSEISPLPLQLLIRDDCITVYPVFL